MVKGGNKARFGASVGARIGTGVRMGLGLTAMAGARVGDSVKVGIEVGLGSGLELMQRLSLGLKIRDRGRV